MANPIFTIWRKELIDTVRDRRTLASTILLPLLLMPALFIGIAKFSTWQINQLNEKEVRLAVSQVAGVEDLTGFLTNQDKKIKISTTSESVEQLVKEKQVELGLRLPNDWRQRLDRFEAVPVEMVTNSTNQASSAAAARLAAGLNAYNQTLITGRLAAAELPPTLLAGLTPTPVDVASTQEQAGFGLGFILPLFIIMWAVTGGQTTAIDASAGERERKTLESLLLTPISRFTIVAGKFLAVCTGAFLSVVISITSMTWASKYLGDAFTTGSSLNAGGLNTGAAATGGFNLEFQLTPSTVAILLGISVILVALFSALNLSIAIFAKNYKEAQSYIGPSYLVVILPVVLVNTLPQVGDSLGMYAIPIVNAVLLFKEVLLGQIIWPHIALTASVLVATSALAIWAATRIYQREDVIFTD